MRQIHIRQPVAANDEQERNSSAITNKSWCTARYLTEQYTSSMLSIQPYKHSTRPQSRQYNTSALTRWRSASRS
jgi:hypothetical protein